MLPNDTFDFLRGPLTDAKRNIAYFQKAKENRINAHSFMDMCRKLKPAVNAIAVEHKHVKQTERLLTHAKANIANTFQSIVEKQEYCLQLLLSRKLAYKGTRHNATLFIGQYLKDLGNTQEQTIAEVKAFAVKQKLLE